MGNFLKSVLGFGLAILLFASCLFALLWSVDAWSKKLCRDDGAQLGVKTVLVGSVCYVEGEMFKPLDVYKWERGVRP